MPVPRAWVPALLAVLLLATPVQAQVAHEDYDRAQVDEAALRAAGARAVDGVHRALDALAEGRDGRAEELLVNASAPVEALAAVADRGEAVPSAEAAARIARPTGRLHHDAIELLEASTNLSLALLPEGAAASHDRARDALDRVRSDLGSLPDPVAPEDRTTVVARVAAELDARHAAAANRSARFADAVEDHRGDPRVQEALAAHRRGEPGALVSLVDAVARADPDGGLDRIVSELALDGLVRVHVRPDPPREDEALRIDGRVHTGRFPDAGRVRISWAGNHTQTVPVQAGRYRAKIPAGQLEPGVHDLSLTVEGTALPLEPVHREVRVRRAPSLDLSTTGPLPNGTLRIVARLTAAGGPVADADVEFLLRDLGRAQVPTDPRGRAVLRLSTADLPSGSYDTAVRFAGNATLAPATEQGTVAWGGQEAGPAVAPGEAAQTGLPAWFLATTMLVALGAVVLRTGWSPRKGPTEEVDAPDDDAEAAAAARRGATRRTRDRDATTLPGGFEDRTPSAGTREPADREETPRHRILEAYGRLIEALEDRRYHVAEATNWEVASMLRFGGHPPDQARRIADLYETARFTGTVADDEEAREMERLVEAAIRREEEGP